MSFFPFLTPLPSQSELLIYDSEYTGGSPLLCAFTHAIPFFWNVTSCPSTFLPSSGQPCASVKVYIPVSFLKEAFLDILSTFPAWPSPHLLLDLVVSLLHVYIATCANLNYSSHHSFELKFITCLSSF